jgi:hypothetical protein
MQWPQKESSMPADIIYFSRFLPSVERGGGSRRLMQICLAVKGMNAEWELVSTQRQDRLSMEAVRRIEKSLAGKLKKKPRFWSEKRWPAACRLGEISREWSRQIGRENRRLPLAILDDPIYFIPLFEKMKRLAIPLIGICHNLESLAPEQVAADPRRSLMQREIALLGQCRLVITISREETFLLHNLGINTLFFPYYPVEPIVSRLLQVREKRNQTDKEGILLLGNVLNLQTRQGMETMIDFWEDNELFREHGKLLVAGYGTEHYLGNSGSRAIEFLGGLADDELERRLTRVKACLCFQEQGSGALTRIGEMLIADVPVLANSHAARSYYNRKGVIGFHDLKDLAGALQQAEKWNEEIPVPLAPETSGLIDRIKKIMMTDQ